MTIPDNKVPRISFLMPLTMGECIKLLRTRKKWSINKLAQKFNKINGAPTLDECKNMISDIEENNLDVNISDLIGVSEILGFHLDLHIKKDSI